MNLQDIRQYIANIIDYDPSTNREYTQQIDDIINHHYRMLFSEKAFTFAQKEQKIEVYTDVEKEATASYDVSTRITTVTVASGVPTWAEGNIVEIEGEEYEVLYNEPGNVTECYVYANVQFTGTKTIKFKNRFVRLPVDCVALLQVGRRSFSISPTDVGRFIPLTRYEDEYYNLPLDEVNIPNYWIMQDDFMLSAPNVAPTISAQTASAGQGTRSVRVAQTYLKWQKNGAKYEVESGLSKFSEELELADNQILRIDFPSLPAAKPYARRFYVYNADNDPAFDGYYRIDEQDPGASGSTNVTFTQTEFEDGTFVLDKERFQYTEGYRQQLRLYPRQSEDFELSVRYVYIPKRLQEPTDTPELPQSHHLILAYACLMDVLNKHDNPTLAGIYRRKYEREVVKMEQRFLTQKPRRFVKGFMKESGVDTVPMFTPLRRIP
jgi:hypothetical protein